MAGEGIDIDDLIEGTRYVITKRAGYRGRHVGGPFTGTFINVQQGQYARFRDVVTNAGAPTTYYLFDPNGMIFTHDIRGAVGKKAKDQAVRDMYDKATRDPCRKDEYGKPMAQSGAPGHGPADLIRKAMGVQPPRGAMGGRTRRRRSRKTRRSRK
jgi:hypothetical protein